MFAQFNPVLSVIVFVLFLRYLLALRARPPLAAPADAESSQLMTLELGEGAHCTRLRLRHAQEAARRGNRRAFDVRCVDAATGAPLRMHAYHHLAATELADPSWQGILKEMLMQLISSVAFDLLERHSIVALMERDEDVRELRRIIDDFNRRAFRMRLRASPRWHRFVNATRSTSTLAIDPFFNPYDFDYQMPPAILNQTSAKARDDDTLPPHAVKIQLLNVSRRLDEQEFATLRHIPVDCAHRHRPRDLIAYVHDKGARGRAHSRDWRRLLMYFLLGRADACVRRMWSSPNASVVACGAERVLAGAHLSGNFWLTTCQHVLTLPPLPTVNFTENRMEAEFWLLRREASRESVECLFKSNVNHYDYDYSMFFYTNKRLGDGCEQ